MPAPAPPVLRHRLDGAEVAAVERLAAAAAAPGGDVALDEHRWYEVSTGGPEAEAAVLLGDPATGLDAYAQVCRGGDGWAVDVVVRPGTDDDRLALGGAVLRAALGVVGARGGGAVQHWVSRPGPVDDRRATAAGLVATRDLLQLRRPLPVEDQEWSLDVRPFRPGVDDDAWLEVNNRAFAWHPEQGLMDREALAARQREPWFDADGFLLHDGPEGLDGFCWTKVHAAHDPPLGEIYVIATHPERRTRGLGRALTLAGLDWLARHGVGVGMLYVEADNHRAVDLYGRIGFTVHHVDRAFTGVVAPGADRAQPTPTPTADPMA